MCPHTKFQRNAFRSFGDKTHESTEEEFKMSVTIRSEMQDTKHNNF